MACFITVISGHDKPQSSGCLLDYTEIQRGRTKLFCIHYRRPRLKAPNDESKENPLPPSPAEKVSPEMAEKLALLEKLGITLDDLEKLFKSR